MAYNNIPVNYGYQPYYGTPTYPVQQNQSNVIQVHGIEGAKAYMVAPGNTVLLMDSDAPTFYWKSADAAGMATLRVFDFKERDAQPAPTTPAPAYVTKEEFEEFKKSLNGGNGNG